MRLLRLLLLIGQILVPYSVSAQSPTPPYSPEDCPSCAGWNAPRSPLQLFGNSYWVGTAGLGAILITSEAGHVLIDSGLPESAALIMESVRALGFDPGDIRVILNSHAHYDHAGGTAELQRLTGAAVVATGPSAAVLRRGLPGEDDPQHESALPFPPVARVDVVESADTVRVGPLALVAHLTPGHSPGGTTWSWQSCEGMRCADVVYADSQTPVSDDGFRYSDGDRTEAFEQGLTLIEHLSCDLLVTPHPGASGLWDRVEARESGDADALFDPGACRRYAERGREQLAGRIARERAGR